MAGACTDQHLPELFLDGDELCSVLYEAGILVCGMATAFGNCKVSYICAKPTYNTDISIFKAPNQCRQQIIIIR